MEKKKKSIGLKSSYLKNKIGVSVDLPESVNVFYKTFSKYHHTTEDIRRYLTSLDTEKHYIYLTHLQREYKYYISSIKSFAIELSFIEGSLEYVEYKSLRFEEVTKTEKITNYRFVNELIKEYEGMGKVLFSQCDDIEAALHFGGWELAIFLKDKLPDFEILLETVENEILYCKNITDRLNQQNTSIANYLNTNTFFKYRDTLRHGYYDDNFIRDLESIQNIEDKIIFLNYIISQIDDDIESIQFAYDMVKIQIEKYGINNYKVPLQELLNKKVEYDEYLGFYDDSKRFLNEKINFWTEQLNIKSGHLIIKPQSTDEFIVRQNEPIKLPKFVWLGTRQQLITLFQLLNENDFLQISNKDIDLFLNNFIDSKGKCFSQQQSSQIKWFGTQRELTYLLTELTQSDINLLSDIDIWKITKSVFLNKSSQPFKSLSVSNQNPPAKTKPILTKLINQTKKS